METVKLPREPARKTLAQLNPENFPPMRNSIDTMDLTLLDKVGTDKPYKKGVKDQYPSVLKLHQHRRKRDQPYENSKPCSRSRGKMLRRRE